VMDVVVVSRVKLGCNGGEEWCAWLRGDVNT
jgi:hypothetical protein